MSISHRSYEPVGSTPLKDTFFQAMGLDEGEQIYIDTDSETDQDTDSAIGEQSSYDYCPQERAGMLKKLSNIEDLINCNDYVGAAEEILKLNIATIPQNLFDRFTDALETTAENLALKETYLNSQLASQSLVVMSIRDELQENGILFSLKEADNAFTMEDLGLAAFSHDSDVAATLAWINGEIGDSPTDEYNPQNAENTAVLARFMTQQTEGDHRSASMAHNDALARHVYNLEMRLGG